MSLRVLLTGTPGWLGTRMAEALAGRVAELAAFGRAYSGAELRCLVGPGAEASELEAWGLRVLHGDVRDPASLREAMEGVDLVFHLVGIIHPRRIREFYELNTLGTRHVLDAAVVSGARRIVYVSSNAAAGVNASKDRLMAEQDALRPRGHYGRSKLLAERAIADAHGAGRIEGVVLRPCWYYGPYQPPRQTRFFRMIQGGRPPLFGDGSNLRSLSYTDNVVQALLLAGRSEKAGGQTYWIADERPYPTAEIYGTLARLLSAPELRPRRFPGAVSAFCRAADAALQGAGLYCSELHVAGEMDRGIACSIEKARRELGYRPTVALEEGMRRSIDWCRSAGRLPA